MLGVVKLVTPVPPASTVPPVADAYQSMVSPAAAVAVKLSVPGPQREKGPAPAVGTAGAAVTVATIATRVADTQAPAVLLASA